MSRDVAMVRETACAASDVVRVGAVGADRAAAGVQQADVALPHVAGLEVADDEHEHDAVTAVETTATRNARPPEYAVLGR